MNVVLLTHTLLAGHLSTGTCTAHSPELSASINVPTVSSVDDDDDDEDDVAMRWFIIADLVICNGYEEKELKTIR